MRVKIQSDAEKRTRNDEFVCALPESRDWADLGRPGLDPESQLVVVRAVPGSFMIRSNNLTSSRLTILGRISSYMDAHYV